jgi:hypothetical protein
MTKAKEINGTVKFSNSFPAPSSHQTVRILLRNTSSRKVDLKEIRATDVQKETRSFSFLVAADNEYQIWAETGTIKTDLRTFSLQEDGELASVDFVFE